MSDRKIISVISDIAKTHQGQHMYLRLRVERAFGLRLCCKDLNYFDVTTFEKMF